MRLNCEGNQLVTIEPHVEVVVNLVEGFSNLKVMVAWVNGCFL